MRILLLIPYFGPWPDYFNLFLHSVKQQESVVDFCIITDNIPSQELPSNVRIERMSFRQLISTIEKKVDVSISELIPYKLCDFRPAFGIVFNDIIKDYDFWGYCDIDLIFGKLSAFLNDEVLSRYDILSFKKGHLQGPFTLYRNNNTINTLYTIGGHYKHVFSVPEYCSFDEFGTNCFYVNIKSENEIDSLPDNNISVIVFKEKIKKNLRIYNEQHVKEDLSNDEILVCEKDQLYDFYTGEPYFFFHWVLDKRNIWFEYPSWMSNPPEKYYITNTGFYSYKSTSVVKRRHYFRLLIGFCRWWVLKSTNFIKRRLGIKVHLDTYPRIGWVKRLT